MYGTWMKLNLMTFEFNVDRFYAQLGAFSIFTISHIREMKPGSNWIPWPMNLMLKDFTPNWALFLFSSIHMLEGWNLDQIESHDQWILMLTDFTPNWALFLFSLFHTKEGSKSKKKAGYGVISMTQHRLVFMFLFFFCFQFVQII